MHSWTSWHAHLLCLDYQFKHIHLHFTRGTFNRFDKKNLSNQLCMACLVLLISFGQSSFVRCFIMFSRCIHHKVSVALSRVCACHLISFEVSPVSMQILHVSHFQTFKLRLSWKYRMSRWILVWISFPSKTSSRSCILYCILYMYSIYICSAYIF